MKPRKLSGNLSSTSCKTAIVDLDNSTQYSLEETPFSLIENEFTDFEVATNKPVEAKIVKRNSSSANEIWTIENRKLELFEKNVQIANERDDNEVFTFHKAVGLGTKIRMQNLYPKYHLQLCVFLF